MFRAHRGRTVSKAFRAHKARHVTAMRAHGRRALAHRRVRPGPVKQPRKPHVRKYRAARPAGISMAQQLKLARARARQGPRRSARG